MTGIYQTETLQSLESDKAQWLNYIQKYEKEGMRNTAKYCREALKIVEQKIKSIKEKNG